MSFLRRKGRIRVEAKVMGILGGDYVSVITPLTLPRGARVKTLVRALLQGGHVDKATYSTLKRLRPPLRVLINGEDAPRGRRAGLEDGDTVSIFTPLVGG